MKHKGLIFLTIGIGIAFFRIFIIGHYQATNVRLVPEILMIISFVVQTLCLALGIALWICGKRWDRSIDENL
ncbi:hypothetical protein ACE1TI_18010 [Alteribacillus sp. JSM 102045]|uniref:hypothetical protein n=1 Tax=Alteribacillus sp. JSM 102045 TaxID=1562101 RepID=UPI0035C13E28